MQPFTKMASMACPISLFMCEFSKSCVKYRNTILADVLQLCGTLVRMGGAIKSLK